MKPINLLLIGCGPHAKRSYLPGLKQLNRRYPLALKAVVELEGNESSTQAALAGFGSVELIATPPFIDDYQLPATLAKRLDQAVAKHSITGVIIATEPTAHMQYALWALRRNLHIILDKPISMHPNSSNDPAQAQKLQTDYHLLMAGRRPDRAFLINVQRRHRPDFRRAFELVDEVAARYGIPITAMQSAHADGQWRLPHEILTESYHGYNAGVGKVSHGGYHLLDIIGHGVLRSFAAAGKTFDKVGVYSSFIRPQGLLHQQTRADYQRVFGPDYAIANSLTDDQLRHAFTEFGEVDASSLITLYQQNEPIANLTLNLIHNSFTRRSWLDVNPDLYNGNGRVRHEHYNIQQGSYQNIQIHAYHAGEESLTNGSDDHEVGGNEHFDIMVFRNSGLMGGQPLEIIRSRDLVREAGYDTGTVLVEQAKRQILCEFIEMCLGLRKPSDTYTDISSHALTAKFMSLVHQSGIKRREVKSAFDPNHTKSRRHLVRFEKTSRPLGAHVRILGADVTGKTTLVEALRERSPDIIGFGATPSYVYQWLRAYGIGGSSDVQPHQARQRERVFMRFNEHEATIIKDILPEKSVVAVRGRADTVLTHAAFNSKPLPRQFATFFPPGMRPDLLVVLTASSDVIAARLQAAGENATGANSIDFHDKCQDMYLEIAQLAQRYFPVLTFDTSNPVNTPASVAEQVGRAIESIQLDNS